MPYLKSMSVKQPTVGPIGVTTVEVSWVAGNLPFDAIEVRYGTSQHLEVGSRAAVVEVEAGAPTSVTAQMPAPFTGYIGVFPMRWRVDDGGPGEYPSFESFLPDDGGQLLFWTAAGLVDFYTLAVKPVNPAPPPLEAPLWKDPQFGDGTVLLSWTEPQKAENYEVRYTRGGVRGYITPPGPAVVLYRTRVGEVFNANVRGSVDQVFGENRSTPWSRTTEFVIPDGRGYAPLRLSDVQTLAAVGRGDDHTVLLAGAGAAYTLNWSPVTGWQDWVTIGGGPIEPAAPVSAISRSKDFVDAFTVIDSRVNVAWWAHEGAWHDWAPISDQVFPAKAVVGTAARDPDHMDVFAVDTEGAMRSSWWNGNPWRAWFTLAGATFPPGAPVSASCGSDDVQQIWAVDTTGVMRGAWFDGTWHDWYRMDGPKFPPGAWVTSCALGGRNKDERVAAVDEEGVAYESRWDGQRWSGWMQRPGPELEPGQPIALGNGHLWVVDRAGRCLRWVDSSSTWNISREADPPLRPQIAALGAAVFVVTKHVPCVLGQGGSPWWWDMA